MADIEMASAYLNVQSQLLCDAKSSNIAYNLKEKYIQKKL
jgi:hypothetical protein